MSRLEFYKDFIWIARGLNHCFSSKSIILTNFSLVRFSVFCFTSCVPVLPEYFWLGENVYSLTKTVIWLLYCTVKDCTALHCILCKSALNNANCIELYETGTAIYHNVHDFTIMYRTLPYCTALNYTVQRCTTLYIT